MDYNLKKIETGKWKENCYLLCSGNNCIIIDPGSDEDIIENCLITEQIIPLAILLTHGHYDHIGSVEYFRLKYNIPCYLNSEDLKLLKHANLYRLLFHGERNIDIPTNIIDIKELTSVKISDYDVTVHFTPGHTNGSVSFEIGDYLFTGDTLLKDKTGRYDLPGGNLNKLTESLKKLSLLNPNLTICPGHGNLTNLESELKNNDELIRIINEN